MASKICNICKKPIVLVTAPKEVATEDETASNLVEVGNLFNVHPQCLIDKRNEALQPKGVRSYNHLGGIPLPHFITIDIEEVGGTKYVYSCNTTLFRKRIKLTVLYGEDYTDYEILNDCHTVKQVTELNGLTKFTGWE